MIIIQEQTTSDLNSKDNQKQTVENSQQKNTITYSTGKQLWYMFLLGIMVIPQLYFNASVNALSNLLQPIFGEDIVSTSYLMVSIPTIFALIIFSVIFDSQGPKILQLVCGFVNLIGTAFCVIAVQPKIVNRGLFLTGRFLYGIGGESVCIGQSKLITLTVEKRLHPIAYAFAMIGLIGGELVAIATLPINDDLSLSYIVILITQVLSFAIMVYFFFIIRKQEQIQKDSKQEEQQDENQVSAKNTFKQNFIIILKQLKNLSVYYYLLAITRFLMTACTKVFDSRAVYSMSQIYGLEASKLRSIILFQTITAEVVLIILCFVQAKVTKIQYFTLTGIVCYCVGCLLFSLGTVEDAEAYIYALSIINGVGLGMTISTCSALLVKIAGGNLGASALGYTYAVKYLLISILTPVAQAIGKVDQRINGYLYFALHFIGGVCLVIVICKKLGW